MAKMTRIGKVARMLAISPELLRHYERKRVVEPSYVDNENGYRYYSRKNVVQLFFARFFLSLGLSLNEIADINAQVPPDISAWVSIIEKHQANMKKRIERDMGILATLDDYHAKLQTISSPFATFSIEDSPDVFFFLFDKENEEISSMGTAQVKEMRRWAGFSPMPCFSFICEQAYVEGKSKPGTSQRGLTILSSQIKEKDKPMVDFITHLPSRLSVYSIVQFPTRQSLTTDVYKGLPEFMSANHLELDGDGFGRWLANVKNDNTTEEDADYYRVFEIWIPVKRTDSSS